MKQINNDIFFVPNDSIILILNMYQKQSRNTNRSTDTIASFLLKTYEILQHSEYERIISWDKSNVGFIIHDVLSFTREILPKYFRHSNFSSFVRQLNMYDFHKVKQQNDSLVFKNPLFCKGQQMNLKFIRRKAAKKIGGQRRQQSSQKNDVENQKYENLLKTFKKSIQSQINQSSLFYERSIQFVKDQNQSNQRKKQNIGNLQTCPQIKQTQYQIAQNMQKLVEQKTQKPQISPKRDTIIQIPREFLGLNELVQKQKQNIQPQQSLNLNQLLCLKQQVYRSLGMYEKWLNDYIEIQKKKVRNINTYKIQLTKCLETNQNNRNQNENLKDQEQQEYQQQHDKNAERIMNPIQNSFQDIINQQKDTPVKKQLNETPVINKQSVLLDQNECKSNVFEEFVNNQSTPKFKFLTPSKGFVSLTKLPQSFNLSMRKINSFGAQKVDVIKWQSNYIQNGGNAQSISEQLNENNINQVVCTQNTPNIKIGGFNIFDKQL